MGTFDRILLAVDLGQNTQTVLEAGAYIAKNLHSEIILFHVVPDIKGSPLDPVELQEEAQRLLQDARSATLEGDSFRVRTAVSVGPPIKRIIQAANENDAGAIVIGSGTKEPGEKYQLGVTAEQIIRYSARPVWLIKTGQPLRIDGVLCPVDFSSHSSLALEYALTFARTFNAKLTVVNVVEQLSNVYRGRPLVQPHEQGSYTDDQTEEFEKFLASFDFDGVLAEQLLLQGRAHEEILRLVKERGCHLIVMGSEGRTGLTRLIMGSVAEKVTREVPCSVLTVKSKPETAQ